MNGQGSGPSISVITPCLDGARYVAAAVESVLLQGYPNMQHIVADGGSQDDTLKVLSRYPHLTIFSARDDGMYDALNKALAVAHGELIGILNSDDCYAEHAFSAAIDAFRDDGVMAVAGEAIAFRDGPDGEPLVADAYTSAGSDLLLRCTQGNPAINAWFFRSSVFGKIGRFDATYRVAGDREFMLRFALSGLRYAETKEHICSYRMHSGSMTLGGSEEIWDTVLREHHRLTGHYLSSPGLSKRARQLIGRARTRDTLQGAIYAARHYDVPGLIAHAAAGTRHDLVWPARFAKRAMRELALKVGFPELGGRN
jgi:glycosyltransferase involved in cell wall biosynthesis